MRQKCAAKLIRIYKALDVSEWGESVKDSTSVPGEVLCVACGDACKLCLNCWEMCFRLLYTWIEFCKLIRTDKKFELQFQSSRKSLGDLARRAFHLESVVEKLMCGRRVGRPEIYASARELRELWQVKRLPAMRGVPKITLPSKKGGGYEELYVFADPREPLRTGESFQMVVGERDIYAMHPDQHLHADQGNQIFSKMMQNTPVCRTDMKRPLTVLAAYDKYIENAGGDEDEEAEEHGSWDNQDSGDDENWVPGHATFDNTLYTATGRVARLPIDMKMLLSTVGASPNAFVQGVAQQGRPSPFAAEPDEVGNGYASTGNAEETPRKSGDAQEEAKASPRSQMGEGSVAGSRGAFSNRAGSVDDLDAEGEPQIACEESDSNDDAQQDDPGLIFSPSPLKKKNIYIYDGRLYIPQGCTK